jgi:hypothetical protein
MTNQRPTGIARAAALALGLSIASAPRAAPSASARQEIDYLLAYIGRSGCAFNRNGSWHDAKAAQDHVRTKYDFLLARDRINTAEDFIEMAATKSSVLFGKPYIVKCPADPPGGSNQWLNNALARYRALEP